MSEDPLLAASPARSTTVAVAESLSPSELRDERSLIAAAVAALKEHPVPFLLAAIAFSAGSTGLVLWYTRRAAWLSASSSPSSPSSPANSSHFHERHPQSPAIAHLQRQASRAIRHRDYSAALSALSRAIALTSFPPPSPEHLLSSLFLDRANVHFLLQRYLQAFADAAQSAEFTRTPNRSRALLLQGRSRMMERQYAEACDRLVEAVHEERRREREEGHGDAEVSDVARRLLNHCVKLKFSVDDREEKEDEAEAERRREQQPPPAEAASSPDLTTDGITISPAVPALPSSSAPPTRASRSSSSAASLSEAPLSSASASSSLSLPHWSHSASGDPSALRPPSPGSPLSPVSPASPSILDALRAANATAEKKRAREEQKRRAREAAARERRTVEKDGAAVESKEASPTAPPTTAVNQWRQQYKARQRVAE